MYKADVFRGSERYTYWLDNEHIHQPIKRKGVPYEYKLLRYISDKYGRKSGDIIDVGAHQGNHALFFAKFCLSYGKVRAFEPSDRCVRILRNNIFLNSLSNDITVYNCGLYDRKGLHLLVPTENEANLDNPCWKLLSDDEDHRDYDNVSEVHVRALDNFEFNDVKVIKIDAEGMEEKILEGATQTIEENRPAIFIEFGDNQENLRYFFYEHDYVMRSHFRDGVTMLEFVPKEWKGINLSSKYVTPHHFNLNY